MSDANDTPKVRPLIATMQKNEGEMLRAWALYHADIFSKDCIAIFDNGSTDKQTLEILDDLSRDGFLIVTDFPSKFHFETKGDILGNFFRHLRNRYDLFIPMDCDEFIATKNAQGYPSVVAREIHEELSQYLSYKGTLEIAGSYYNTPNSVDKFFFHPEDKVFFSSGGFISVDMGFHFGESISNTSKSTKIVHLHLSTKPLAIMKSHAKEKLASRVKNNDFHGYKGPGQHLVRFLDMEEEEYLGSFNADTYFSSLRNKFEDLGVRIDLITGKESSTSRTVHDFDTFKGLHFPEGHNDSARTELVRIARKLSQPVLDAFGKGTLKEDIPRFSAPGKQSYAIDVSPLEAIGRLFAGIAPWLEIDSESSDLMQYLVDGIEAEASGKSKQLDWSTYGQALVDASYFSFGMLRCPAFFDGLSSNAKAYIRDGLTSAIQHKPFNNNWILMPAIINVCLRKYWGEGDSSSVLQALTKVDRFYAGDGLYKDGPFFAMDYYNSFVFHPYILEIAKHCKEGPLANKINEENAIVRARRAAEILERLITQDAEMPVVGRSITYRSAPMFLMAYLALTDNLGASISRATALSAITEVQKRYICGRDIFNSDGFLNPGLFGLQKALAEDYITSGSLYMTSLPLVILGLGKDHPIWSEPEGLWTSRKIHCRHAELLRNDASLERKNNHQPSTIIRS